MPSAAETTVLVVDPDAGFFREQLLADFPGLQVLVAEGPEIADEQLARAAATVANNTIAIAEPDRIPNPQSLIPEFTAVPPVRWSAHGRPAS